MRIGVLNSVVNTGYLLLIIIIFLLVAYNTGCAADSGMGGDYYALIENLRKDGAVVEPKGEVAPNFLSAKRLLISVNDSNVQVWDYEDAAAADAEAALISPDGYSIRTATKIKSVGWIAPPHFYKAGKLIVLYVGERETVTVALERVLGPRFAGC